MVQTPVLFETFVRVDYARQVWEAIKAAQPKKLYFYSNKGRAEKEGEIERNNEIRSWVKEIDWDCELHTFFRDECVDIYTSLKGALDWVFSSEPEAIVLEDDCVPTPAFFSFCDQMIEKYRDNKKVWCISGDNFMDYKAKDADYFFSQYHFMWGWASWSDRWHKIEWGNLPIDKMIKEKVAYEIYSSKREAKYRNREIKGVEKKANDLNCWDYAFGITIDYYRGVTVQPNYHLVTCVGLFGTHSKVAKKTMFHIKANAPSETYIIKKHPAQVMADKDYDYPLFKRMAVYMMFINRVYRRLYAKVKGWLIK